MGVLNITPDSFYSESSSTNHEEVVALGSKLVREGCDILDIGAMSSRPGAEIISPDEELNRLKEPFLALRSAFPEVLISIDTVHARVAEYGLANGADMINDISAGSIDAEILDVVARYPCYYCLMHMKNKPVNMQNDTSYEELSLDIFEFFRKKLDLLKSKGIQDIIIDPGFGFGKSLEQNYKLLNHLGVFKLFDYPILVGLSRKSMIYKYLDIKPEEALVATSLLNMVALQNGANILRVHDVQEANQTIKLFQKLESTKH